MASIASTALSCLITEEKAYGMTVMMTRRVKRRMMRVGMMSLMSLLVTDLSPISSMTGCLSLTAVAGVWSLLRT